MSIFFEKKIGIHAINFFLVNIFDVVEDEIKIFQDDYFFDKGYLDVNDNIKCLCTYRDLIGDVKIRLEFYRVDDQTAEFMVEKVKKFISKNIWDGFIIVENIDDEYLKIGNNLTQSVCIKDDLIEDDIVYFVDK